MGPHATKRCDFSEALAELVLWIRDQGWRAAFDEVTVHSPRAARYKLQRVQVEDAVHKKNSFHHSGLAADLLLYVDGDYVEDGDHPAWKAIAARWEEMNEEATSGRRFRDANHCSWGEGSKEDPL